MAHGTLLRLAALAALAGMALAGCGFGGGDSSTTSTLPTLPPSSGTTTPRPTEPPTTAAPTTPPLTAPIGGPNTLPPIPGLATTTPPTSAASGGPITYVREPASGALRVGHRGARVQTMQGQLAGLGYQLGVDGYFGRGTEAAVRQFQQAQGLPADGIAGPATLAQLSQLTGG